MNQFIQRKFFEQNRIKLEINSRKTSAKSPSIWKLSNILQDDSWIWRRKWQPTLVTLAWKIPWTEEPGRLQSMGSWRVGHDWATSLSLFTFMPWRRNDNPLQYSCVENSRDGGAWWAAVYGVTQSWTWLKWLSSHSSGIPQFYVYIYLKLQNNMCIFGSL